ncbi:MAG: phosphoribosylglycinamide formyltransferase [Ezakiella sp.]|nr:phosphoribosylglycinamide formyltransferase [Ezakiella sp.]
MQDNRAIVLVSGSGTNMEAIARGVEELDIRAVFSDRECYGILRASKLGIYSKYINKNFFEEIEKFVKDEEISLIILAGFLKIISSEFVEKMPLIVNIHPSRLPKYGGKGYYGEHVHEAVFSNHELFSGATVHIVDGGVDSGRILLQSMVDISQLKSADEIAKRVLETEHQIYKMAIKMILNERRMK